jgi:ABC-2 type transport system permease protein
MWPLYRSMLARFRGQILGWGLALFLLSWPVVSTYDVVHKEQQRIEQLAKNFAPFIAMMGGNIENLTSPAAYLSMRYFALLPVILGIFALLGGSGLLASDEENGTLDLVLAHPVSRTTLFLGRWLAFCTALLGILTLACLGVSVWMRGTLLRESVSQGEIILPYCSLLAALLFFGNLALLLSMVLPSRRAAASVTGMVLVVSFFLTSLARLDPGLHALARFSPLDYYQSGEAVHGLNVTWLAGLLTLAGLFTVLAWWCFERRDIRVAGERAWRWPLLRRQKTAPF